MPRHIRITRAAMAVLEECRRGDAWAAEPVYIGDGYQVEVDDEVFTKLTQVAQGGETYSDVILRVYRTGGAIRPEGAP